jgi:hypothetical protein
MTDPNPPKAKFDMLLGHSRRAYERFKVPPLKPFTLQEWQEIEQVAGGHLPDNYKKFCMNCGQMEFEQLGWSHVDVAFDMGASVVHRWGVLMHVGPASFVFDAIKTFAGDSLYFDDVGPRIPPGMLPIGRIMMKTTGLLLMKTSEPRFGSIWAWERVEETWGTGDNRFLGFLCETFPQLFEIIEHYDPKRHD